MFRKKLASLALMATLAVGSLTTPTYATDLEDTTGPTIPHVQTFKDNGRTLEGLKKIKGHLTENELTLSEAKANFEAKLTAFAAAKGITLEEAKAAIAALQSSGKDMSKLKDLKASLEEKGVSLEDAKINFEETTSAQQSQVTL